MIEQNERKRIIGTVPQLETVNVYTDGSCLGNPGAGGYSAIIVVSDTHKDIIRGHERNTTNNRMELMAVITALELIRNDAPVTIFSDSQYVINSMTKWLQGWKSKGWKTADAKPVKNRDLLERLDAVVVSRANCVMWRWVRGHNGNVYQDEADRIAREEAYLAEELMPDATISTTCEVQALGLRL